MRCAARVDERLDVALRHAAAVAGAGHLRRVDAVLGGDARDDGETNDFPFPDASLGAARVPGLRRLIRRGLSLAR